MLVAVLAALLAGLSLLPKAKSNTGVVAAIAVLGALLVIAEVINTPTGFSIGWAMWLLLGASVFQAVAAVAAVLLDAGVITAPAPRPKYDPYAQYGAVRPIRPVRRASSRRTTVSRPAQQQPQPHSPAAVAAAMGRSTAVTVQSGSDPERDPDPVRRIPTTGGFGAQSAPQPGPSSPRRHPDFPKLQPAAPRPRPPDSAARPATTRAGGGQQSAGQEPAVAVVDRAGVVTARSRAWSGTCAKSDTGGGQPGSGRSPGA